MRKVLKGLAAFALLATVLYGSVRWGTSPLEWRNTFDGDGCCVDIVHAGGLLDGVPYTNSLEALNANYAAGRRVFEVDFELTSDGVLVLAHDWDAYGGWAPSHNAFLAAGPHTHLDFAGFVVWIAEVCGDCRIVTDPKIDFGRFWEIFAATVPVEMQKRQFVLQTYDFATARTLHVRAPLQPQILTLYRVEDIADDDLRALTKIQSMIAVTMSLDRVPLEAGKAMRLSGKPVFSHGYPWAIRSEFILRLARLFGVTGFYKD